MKLKYLFGNARRILKQIGLLSRVDIEPDQQTLLADKTEEIPGVLCAGVPGAGGYDAMFVLHLGTRSRHQVEELWASWSDSHGTKVCPLALKSEGFGMGIKLEVTLN